MIKIMSAVLECSKKYLGINLPPRKCIIKYATPFAVENEKKPSIKNIFPSKKTQEDINDQADNLKL
ncbi:MAG: hypothetical protein ACXU8A_07960, partial [Burkholderiaceae bacterium]